MTDSEPTSPADEFDFDDVEAFETLLDDTDAAENRRTTWETENYSALVEIERRLDEVFGTPGDANIAADRTHTVSTARLTPTHQDDQLVSLAQRSSMRLSVRALSGALSATQRDSDGGSPTDNGIQWSSNLLSTTVARRTFLRSVLAATGATSPGKKLRAVANSIMRSSRNTRESVCSDSITTPRGASTTSGSPGLPPTSKEAAFDTATRQSLKDPTRFVDFVLGRLVKTSTPEEGGGVTVVGTLAEATKLVPVLANFCKRNVEIVVPYLVTNKMRNYTVRSIMALEHKFGALDRRVSNANGHIMMLIVHHSVDVFTSKDLVDLVRMDIEQRKYFETLEASPDGKLASTCTATQRSEGAGDATAAATAGEKTPAENMRQTSVYTSPLVPDASLGITSIGAATFTLQHPRMLRVEWIPPLLSIVCAARPAFFLSRDLVDLGNELVVTALAPLEVNDRGSSGDNEEASDGVAVAHMISPMITKALAAPLVSVNSELAAATYLFSTISNAFAAASDPERGDDDDSVEEREELHALLSPSNVGALLPLLRSCSRLLSSITVIFCGGNREARYEVSNMALASELRPTARIPLWSSIRAAILSTTTTPMSSVGEVELDRKENVSLSFCVSLASSLAAALECFGDAKKKRRDDDSIDPFGQPHTLVEILLHTTFSVRFLSCHLSQHHSSGGADPSATLRIKQDIRNELHTSLKALLMLPMVIEAVGYLDKNDAHTVLTFLCEGLADGVLQHIHTLPQTGASLALMATRKPQSVVVSQQRAALQLSSVCGELAPYLLGLEQSASSLAAASELIEVARYVKTALRDASVVLSENVSIVAATEQQRSPPSPTGSGTGSPPRQTNSNLASMSATREASLCVVRCVSILRALYVTAASAPRVLVGTSERIQVFVWVLQWLHLLQRKDCDGNMTEAMRSIHSRAVSLLLSLSSDADLPRDLIEGVTRSFAAEPEPAALGIVHGQDAAEVEREEDDSSAMLASPCSVIADAVLTLLRPDESILTLSSSPKPAVALALQMLCSFAAPNHEESFEADEEHNGGISWKFDGLTVETLLKIISLCEDAPTSRTLAWHATHDLVRSICNSPEDKMVSRKRQALGPESPPDKAATRAIESFLVAESVASQHPTKAVFAAIAAVSPLLLTLHRHGMWAPLSGSADALLSGITSKMVAAQRPDSGIGEDFTVPVACIIRILLTHSASEERSDHQMQNWVNKFRIDLENCLSAASSSLDEVPLRLWPVTAVLCNSLAASQWGTTKSPTADSVILESISLLRSSPPQEDLLYVRNDEMDALEAAIKQSLESLPSSGRDSPPFGQLQQQQQQVDSRRATRKESSDASPESERPPIDGVSKPPMNGEEVPLAFAPFQCSPRDSSDPDSSRYRASSPIGGGNMSDSSPRSANIGSGFEETQNGGRTASGGGVRRRSKQFDNPQKMIDDLEAVSKSLALKRYQLSEVNTKLKVSESKLAETREALENDAFHLQHVREAIECVDPEKFFSRDEVRRRQKIGDKSIKQLDYSHNTPLPNVAPPYDIGNASVAAKKALDNLSDQFHRSMAAAVDTNDRNKLREAAATLTLERQLFEKEKCFYTKELELAADIVWKKHSRIYELQLMVDDLSRDAEMYKKLKVDFRDSESNCAYFKSVLDQYNHHLVAGAERLVVKQQRRRASSANRSRRLSSSACVVSPHDMMEDDSFEIAEDNTAEDGALVVPPSALSARSIGSQGRPSRPSSAQPTQRDSAMLRPPPSGNLGGSIGSADTHHVSGDVTPSAVASPTAGQSKAWSEKMKLEFGLRSANTRIQRLQHEVNKITVERNSAILEAVDARQKTKFVELMHKCDVHGMAWAEQRIKRLEREKEMYASDTRKAHDTLRETAMESQARLESIQAQLKKVEADRVQVVTTLALELDTARQRITELSCDSRRKDMMITQLTNKLELLRGGGGADGSNSRPHNASQQQLSAMSPGSPSASPQRGVGTSVVMSPNKQQTASPQPQRDGVAPFESIVDKRQDPHLRNFFAWKDMQRHRRMKQR